MELGGSFLFKGILDISGRKIITGEIYFYARPEGDQIPKGELGIKGGGGGGGLYPEKYAYERKR